MSRGKQVAIVQQSVRRYREGFYRDLRAALADEGIELRLLHSTPPADQDPRGDGIRIPWAERVPLYRLPFGGRRLAWQACLSRLRQADLVIVEQASQFLLNYLLLAAQQMGRTRVAYWGHGRSFSASASSTGELLKRWTSRRPYWWFAYTEETAEIVASLGFPPDRITVVRNAIDTGELERQLDAVTEEDVIATAKDLDIGGGNVAMFLGTLDEGKRLDFLLEAVDRVHSEMMDFEFIVAGNGASAGMIEEALRSRPWMRYVGHRAGEDLAPLLRLSKLLLVPGWVGLVVVDSFTAGLPLVASASGAHPPEIAYLQDGVNGRLVDDGGDPARYAKAVVELLSDEQRRQVLVAGCIEASRRYSAEDMAARFAAGIVGALGDRHA